MKTPSTLFAMFFHYRTEEMTCLKSTVCSAIMHVLEMQMYSNTWKKFEHKTNFELAYT